MQPHSYISDFDSLRKWFDAQGCVKWNLYRGFHERMPERSIVHKQVEDQISPEESWALLQDFITMTGNGGGKFTIFMPAYGASKGPSIFFGLSLNGVRLPAGLGGMPAQAGYGHAAMGMISADDVQRRIEEALEKQRLERKVEDLEAAIGQKSTWQDVLFEKVLQMDPDKAISALGNFLQQSIQQPAVNTVQVRGIHKQAPQTDAVEQETPPASGQEYDGDRLVVILDTLIPHFEDQDALLTFLEKVATRFCDNPALYRGLIEGDG